jgi:hypothetical protein
MMAKIDAETEAIRAETKAVQAKTKVMRDKRMETNRRSEREGPKGMMAEMNAKMDANQAELRSIICTFRSELKETIQHEMRASIQSVRAELDETTACREATETESDPGMMQSIEEHQETPKEDAVVIHLLL